MILNILSYLIIPIYTILFARNTNWFTCNFSVIGSLANRKNAFLLWGILVGAYFYWILRKILLHIPRSKRELILSTTSLVLLAFAVTTPYLPESLPFQAFLHVIFAFSASVLLLLSLFLIIGKLCRINKSTYGPYLVWLLVITVVSAVLLVLAGIVSSALEIFFTISCVLLIRLLYRRVLKSSSQIKTSGYS